MTFNNNLNGWCKSQPLFYLATYTYDNMGRLIAESTCSGGESGKIYSMTTKADRPEPFEAGEFENKEQMLI